MEKLRHQRVTFRLSNELKNKVDAVAENHETTASEVIRHSLELFVNK